MEQAVCSRSMATTSSPMRQSLGCFAPQSERFCGRRAVACRRPVRRLSPVAAHAGVATVSTQATWSQCGTEKKSDMTVEGIKKLRVITAIKTPYKPCGRFDLDTYDKLVRCQIKNNVEGIIVGGTTGEGQLMSWDDHIRLIAHTVICFRDEICVLGNTGSNATNEAIKATEAGFDVGMHASLQINPYYGKTSREGLIEHFMSVVPMGPAILYNVPGRTGQDIPVDVVEQVAKHRNFAGIKECVGHSRVKHYTDQNIVVWSGNDDECHESRWDHGGTGVISVVSNLVPGLVHQLLHNGRNEALNQKLMPLIKWLFTEPNPIGLNTALSQLGAIQPVFRLPYFYLSKERRQQFVDIVNAIGREHFVGNMEVRVMEDNEFVILGRY